MARKKRRSHNVRQVAQATRPTGRPVRVMSGGELLPLRARYDAATITSENRRHWANADSLSADAAMSPTVRQRVRENARHESDNNCYARGVVETVANETVGTGPRNQMLSKDIDFNVNVEREFGTWMSAVHFACKGRTMVKARVVDGETVGLMMTNPALPTPVKLDLALIEADQLTSPFYTASRKATDGIEYDDAGNPVRYFILDDHPGSDYAVSVLSPRSVPASRVIHWFRQTRPGQRRGLSELAPALGLFAISRRWTLATVMTAETAAEYAPYATTNLPASQEAAVVPPTSEMEISRNTMLFLPEGWDLKQLRAEQPSTTYDMFKRELLKEIGRCLGIPYCIVAGDSSDYNYASGRLDFQTFFRQISIDQAQFAEIVLERMFAAWCAEAALVYSWWPENADLSHQWFWDGREHVDPLKEANAQAVKLANGTTTLSYEYAKLGRDWEDAIEQRAKELDKCTKLGIPVSTLRAGQTMPDEPEEPPVVRRQRSALHFVGSGG